MKFWINNHLNTSCLGFISLLCIPIFYLGCTIGLTNEETNDFLKKDSSNPCGLHLTQPKTGDDSVYSNPEEANRPFWLVDRRDSQIKASEEFKVFCGFQFSNMTEESGISFKHRIVDDAGKTYKPVHYDHGNGISVADIDNDGLYDIYFLNQIGANQLWKNIGHGKFKDVTEFSGVAVDDRISVGASFSDIDNDGDPDLYVTAIRSGNILFENDGAGKFEDITEQSGLGYKGHSSGALFFDYNRDGMVDLFLTNVGKYTTNIVRNTQIEDMKEYEIDSYSFFQGMSDAFSGHMDKERSENNILFENIGNNMFLDVTKRLNLLDETWSGDVAVLDVNQDGWTDLYVLNMQGNDKYYRNVNGEYFMEDQSVFGSTPWGSMGIRVFDFDNDGDMDVFVTDMHSDMFEQINPVMEKLKARVDRSERFLMSNGMSIFGNAFYENLGRGEFREISGHLMVENYWPWGPSSGDINADGFEDLFISASMNYPFRYGVNSVLLNSFGEKFLDSEFILGIEPRINWQTVTPWFEVDCSGVDLDHPDCLNGDLTGDHVIWASLGSRSSVMFDLDNDGDLDIVTNDFNSKPMVLINNLESKNEGINFIKVKLEGMRSNRDGLGALVKVYAGTQVYSKIHDGKSGYLSQSSLPLYFGLSNLNSVDKIEVLWPSGFRQNLEGPINGNQLVSLMETETE